jgi:DNA ligase (NAD+)
VEFHGTLRFNHRSDALNTGATQLPSNRMVESPAENPYVEDPPLDFVPVDSLDADDADAQVEALRGAIEYHDHCYYVENDPVISDRVYDQLFDRLQALEENFDRHDSNSPTQRVGAEALDELETVDHVAPMLSLDSSADPEEVRAFDDRVREAVGAVTYSVEPKFDGFSIEVVYDDGAFDRAVTRGDGERGEDVSANVRTIGSVPLHLPEDAPDTLAVRGEIYMPRSGFQALNEERLERGEDPFANPRNAAAGTVRQLDPSVVADRPLDVFFYDVIETGESLRTQSDAYDLLETLGFRVEDSVRTVDDVESILEYRENMVERREDLEYEVDGVVVKVEDFDAREQLGATARHPRWAFAYKLPANTGETTVQNLTVQVGRTGKLTPVALLEPVDVGGVTISRATVHNEEQAQKLGVGVGATVTIERAGDVIPQIDEVLEPGEDVFEMPEACPVCDTDAVQDGPNHFCPNVSCPARLKESIEHFSQRGAMDVEGVGEALAETLVATGLVESLADLYDLTVEDLASLEGYGERSAQNVLEELDASKDVELSRFLFALGIRRVGSERARQLAAAFTLEDLRGADREELLAVEDVGPEVATAIADFFETEANQRLIDRLLDAGIEPTRPERGDELEGQTFVFTGSIGGYSRSEATEILERNGASVTSSVSSRSDVLVVGENPGATKLEDAEEHDVETMDEATFREEILGHLEAE